MEQHQEIRSYPLYSLEIPRQECRYPQFDTLLDHLQERIEQHPQVQFLGRFDHYHHTSSLEHGEVAGQIVAAVNLLFCFGITLPDPKCLAERPRSLGVAETEQGFCLSYLQTPMPLANREIECWLNELCIPS